MDIPTGTKLTLKAIETEGSEARPPFIIYSDAYWAYPYFYYF